MTGGRSHCIRGTCGSSDGGRGGKGEEGEVGRNGRAGGRGGGEEGEVGSVPLFCLDPAIPSQEERYSVAVLSDVDVHILRESIPLKDVDDKREPSCPKELLAKVLCGGFPAIHLMNRKDLSTKNLKSVQKLHWGVFCRVKQPLDDVMRDGKILCGVLQRRLLALAGDTQEQSTVLTDHTHLCQLTHLLQHSMIRWHQHL